MNNRELLILGIRGIPAKHGGFETFAENLALYLVERDWKVTVYCQESKPEYTLMTESIWKGIKRIHIPVEGKGARATVAFDLFSVQRACRRPGLVLTLGYNTAVFDLLLRFKRRTNLINMDGVEWKRDKWKWYEKAWLYINERAGCLIGDHLIADHPEIKNHLLSRVKAAKITMIPYGARDVTSADVTQLERYDLTPKGYAMVIARPEPENSILEIVKAFVSRPRDSELVVLGEYNESNKYQAAVLEAGRNKVKFVGAIYDRSTIDAMRYYSSLYIHGHTVGGTNPSLIEALGAGQAVLAHDNKFNRWVAGDKARYFKNEEECALHLDTLLGNANLLEEMSHASKSRFYDKFTWESILKQYEDLLLQWV